MNDRKTIFNFVSSLNNAKISYCTSQTNRCQSSNILSKDPKVIIII